MKLTKLGVACAAALISSQAFAFGPGTTPDLTLYISGSSGQDKALAALVGGLCTDTLDTFKDNSTGKDYTSFFCTMGTSAGLSGPTKVLINKRSAGGSGQGVEPVADAVPLEAMNIFAKDGSGNDLCTETAAGSHTWSCDITGGVGNGSLQMKVSTAGISDVEPAMFVGPNVPPGALPTTPAMISKLDISSMNAVVFGIPVSTDLYRALQRFQGLDPTKDDIANMPSLSSAMVGSLMTGSIGSWDYVVDANNNPLTSYKAAGETLGSSLVNICRRVPGSGTQAQLNAIFTNTPCDASAPQTIRAPGDASFGPVVNESPESGGVTDCLVAADTNAGGPIWAVGLQALEKSSPNFRFVKIDGVAPTIENVANNTYKDWVETSIQWRNSGANAIDGKGNIPTGDALQLIKFIAANASTPTEVATLNAGLHHAFGVDGSYLALESNGFTPSFPFDPANPVTTSTHAALGTPDSCSPPRIDTSINNVQLGF